MGIGSFLNQREGLAGAALSIPGCARERFFAGSMRICALKAYPKNASRRVDVHLGGDPDGQDCIDQILIVSS
jgi:hypothetical protein